MFGFHSNGNPTPERKLIFGNQVPWAGCPGERIAIVEWREGCVGRVCVLEGVGRYKPRPMG